MRSALAALSAVVLLLAGCSGSGDDEPAPEPATDRIDLTDQGSFEPDGLFTVAPQYAERFADRLDVVVTLTARDLPLTFSTKRAIYVVGPDIVKASTQPDVAVEPGEEAEVPLSFPGDGLGTDGQVTFEVGVGGQPPTSVGFSLVPAG